MEKVSDITEMIAAFDSMGAVKESEAFDELMGFINRREIQQVEKVFSQPEAPPRLHSRRFWKHLCAYRTALL